MKFEQSLQKNEKERPLDIASEESGVLERLKQLPHGQALALAVSLLSAGCATSTVGGSRFESTGGSLESPEAYCTKVDSLKGESQGSEFLRFYSFPNGKAKVHGVIDENGKLVSTVGITLPDGTSYSIDCQ